MLSGTTPEQSLLNWNKKINVALTCDILFMLYRYHPDYGMHEFERCMAPERSDAVKLACIDALITTLIEVRYLRSLKRSKRLLIFFLVRLRDILGSRQLASCTSFPDSSGICSRYARNSPSSEWRPTDYPIL